MVNHYKPHRHNWVPITVFIIGITLAAVAVSFLSLYMTGARFR